MIVHPLKINSIFWLFSFLANEKLGNPGNLAPFFKTDLPNARFGSAVDQLQVFLQSC